MSRPPKPEIRNNPEQQRIETEVDGHLAKIAYRLAENKIIFTHTEVPPELEGRGIASQMAKFALEYAKQAGLQVVPLCPFVYSYIQRHPEYQELVVK